LNLNNVLKLGLVDAYISLGRTKDALARAKLCYDHFPKNPKALAIVGYAYKDVPEYRQKVRRIVSNLPSLPLSKHHSISPSTHTRKPWRWMRTAQKLY
jgi:hypothetical protein